jgi:hypothetical protein
VNGNNFKFINRSSINGFRVYKNELFTTNQGVDTIIVNDSVYIEYNNFNNVFEIREKVFLGDESYIVKSSGESFLSFHENGEVASVCAYNCEFGTIKLFFDKKGRLYQKGAFNKNKKNGLWSFYNRCGRLVRNERYANGILKERFRKN